MKKSNLPIGHVSISIYDGKIYQTVRLTPNEVRKLKETTMLQNAPLSSVVYEALTRSRIEFFYN